VGGAALVAGGTVIAGCLLPWAEIFGGLIGVPGTRGMNGKLLLAGGVLVAAAGLWHLVRGSAPSRWAIGVLGAAVLGYAAYLLLELSASLRSLGGDSMVAVRGGPGLWVVAAGGLLAFATFFLPASEQTAFREKSPAGTGLVAWAADRQALGWRRWLQIGLGVIWVLDAALQYQPYMFTRGFVTQILEPAGMGSPAVISNSVMGTGQVLLSHVVIFNAAFATIQLALGLGLLWRRTSRAALVGTIVWALSVWWLGEGLGMIFSGSASPVTGAPGGAVLYAIVAMLAWPARVGTAGPLAAGRRGASIAAGSRIGLRGAQLIWVALWAGSAYLVLQPLSRAPGALSAAIGGQAGGEPGWIAAMDRGAASALGSGGTALSVALAVVFLIIAAGVFIPAAIRPVLILSVVVALAMWAAGQDFGGLLTGQGTDPGTGPLLLLIAAAFWPLSRTRGAGPGEQPAAPASVPAEVSRAGR
jgi:hypothetical protein